MIFNPNDNKWYMFYTQRRANVPGAGVAYCYGCDIGVAVSEDCGMSWYYLGALDLNFEWGKHTFWAPEVVFYDGTFHMYVTYTKGVQPYKWGGDTSIIHYTSDDILIWRKQSKLNLQSKSAIDACIFQLPNGGFRMWYRNCDAGNTYTWCCDSDNLYDWSDQRGVISGFDYHEGQNVFRYGDYYWLIADTGNGMYVFRSDDLENWQFQKEKILEYPGHRLDDGACGHHGDIVVSGGNAYIFYFTHPERNADFRAKINECMPVNYPYELRRSSVQVAKLECIDGKLICMKINHKSLQLL